VARTVCPARKSAAKRKLCGYCGNRIDRIDLRTGDDYLPALRSFFKQRERRLMVRVTMMGLAQALPDIAPPVSYSLVPPWVVFVASLIALTIIGLAIWYGRRFFRKKK